MAATQDAQTDCRLLQLPAEPKNDIYEKVFEANVCELDKKYVHLSKLLRFDLFSSI